METREVDPLLREIIKISGSLRIQKGEEGHKPSPAAQLPERLRGAPAGLAAEAGSQAKGMLVRALAAVLEPLVAQIQNLTAAVEHTVAQHPTAPW
jgi:transposase